MNQNVWKASGHVAGFSDPLTEDVVTKKRYRADHVLEDFLSITRESGQVGIVEEIEKNIKAHGMTLSVIDSAIKKYGIKSMDGNKLGDVKQFNMMFKTNIGAMEDESSISYLRPETAGGIFMNYKNVLDAFHPKLPFGIAQIGKAFRNEIAPGNFIFRLRELEQMEIEYFVQPKEWQSSFEMFLEKMREWTAFIGLKKEHVYEKEIADEDRAHYSKRTVDIEFEYPFGRKELYGLAYRTDYDLTAHATASGQDLSYFDEANKERFTPHVVEPSFGLDRTILAVLSDAYTVDELGGEKRVYLKLSKNIAPIKVAVFPLLKNKPILVEKAREVFSMLKKQIKGVAFDDNGNIGKRYRRQDEIGTPYCVTIDFDTIEKDNTVTVRDRDTGEQKRVAISELVQTLAF
jgi:glycyl-tRNA synthetase